MYEILKELIQIYFQKERKHIRYKHFQAVEQTRATKREIEFLCPEGFS